MDMEEAFFCEYFYELYRCNIQNDADLKKCLKKLKKQKLQYKTRIMLISKFNSYFTPLEHLSIKIILKNITFMQFKRIAKSYFYASQIYKIFAPTSIPYQCNFDDLRAINHFMLFESNFEYIDLNVMCSEILYNKNLKSEVQDILVQAYDFELI